MKRFRIFWYEWCALLLGLVAIVVYATTFSEVAITENVLTSISGNPIRIRIIIALRDRELRVKEVAELIGGTQPIVSQQLKILRNAGVVRKIRDGRTSRYTLAGSHYTDMIQCMGGCLASRDHRSDTV